MLDSQFDVPQHACHGRSGPAGLARVFGDQGLPLRTHLGEAESATGIQDHMEVWPEQCRAQVHFIASLGVGPHKLAVSSGE